MDSQSLLYLLYLFTMENITEYLTEVDLWKQIISGDAGALEHLYRVHYASMIAYGLKFSNQEDVIKDCIHDIFLKIFENKSLKTPISIHSYLLKAMKNSLYDALKLTYQNENIDNIPFNISIEDTALKQLFANNDEERALSLQLKEAYQSLSANQKQILYLRYVKQLSFKEISSMLDINEQSAMNLSSRTLAKLKKLIILPISTMLIYILANFF